MLALSLFCGGIHDTSTNGWCGFFLVLIEQGGGERLFSEPKVHEEQTGVVCQGNLPLCYHHPHKLGEQDGSLEPPNGPQIPQILLHYLCTTSKDCFRLNNSEIQTQ